MTDTVESIMALADAFREKAGPARQEYAALRAAVEQLVRERDEARALLKEARPYLDRTNWGMPGGDLCARIDALLEKK